MKLLFSGLTLFLSLQLLAQSNPNESTLKQQMASLKNQLKAIEKTIEDGDGKGKFSAAASDSLYTMQDLMMDLNDRLYWLTNKDSLLHAKDNDEVPREDQLNNGNDNADDMEEEKEIPMPKLDSMPNMDWANLMKPKVKKLAIFFQVKYGASFLQDNSAIASGNLVPSWNTKFPSNNGGTLIYAFRLGKADLSKIKMEFNIKKKLTTSKFIKASPWQLRVGIGLHNYLLGEEKGLSINRNEATKVVEFSDNKLNNNILRAYYVHVPITVWRKLSGAAYIEAGGFVDILRQTRHTYSQTQDGIVTTTVRKGNLGLSPFAYGATASIGYGVFAIYGNYQLSSFFKNTDQYKYNLFSVGVKIGY